MQSPSASRHAHRRASLPALLLVAVTIAGTGCKKHQPHEDETSAPATSASTPAPSASVVAPSPSASAPDPTIVSPASEIQVVSAGTGAKRVLSYQFREGAEKKFSIGLTIDPTVTVGNERMPGGGQIELKVSGRTRVEKVAPNGAAERLSTFDVFEPTAKNVPPEALEQLKAQLAQLSGLKIRDTVSAQGKTEKLTLVQGATIPPQVQALLGNLSEGMSHALFRLPSEQLGLGAEWKETGIVESGGLRVQNVITYKLTKLVGDKATIALSSKQSAPAGMLPAEQLPPGASLELLALRGVGDGTLDLDLGTLSLSAKLNSNLEVETKVSGPGAPAPVQSKTATKVALLVALTD